MEYLYRIETTTADSSSRSRQEKKVILFLMLDAAVLTTTCIAYYRMKIPWESCQHDYQAWSISIMIFMVVSLLLNVV